jgi:pilus assembly protein CpaC
MDWAKRTWIEWLVVLLLFLLIQLLILFALFATRPAAAQEPQRITLTRGKSQVLTTQQPVERVSMGDPEVAEIRMLSPRDVYLLGKSPGTTNLILWGKNNQVLQVYDVAVAQELTPLKEMLFEVLPEERDIRVTTRNNAIVLSGTATSIENVSTAMSTAQAFAGKNGQVLNLLQVGGVHQVQLEVKVAEISRNLLRRLGVNLAWISQGGLLTGEVLFTFLNNLTGFDEQGNFIISPEVDAAFTFESGGDHWSGFIDAMKLNGLIKILSEPTLVCLSGQSASFLSGGEFPIPIPQGLGTVAIEYKTFGVGLAFTPIVLGGGKISMQVMPEVSELDFQNAITLAGAVIPAISTRRASTTVELMSGQTFAIAGLVKDNMREAINKFPVLGEIPILGALFRSSEYQQNQTELVILVTPRLAKPLDMATQTLPTDGFIEPNDFEFYLLGMTEGRRSGESLSPAMVPQEEQTGLEGEFGYRMPQAQ